MMIQNLKKRPERMQCPHLALSRNGSNVEKCLTVASTSNAYIDTVSFRKKSMIPMLQNACLFPDHKYNATNDTIDVIFSYITTASLPSPSTSLTSYPREATST
ncbi:hypothetical protein CEXT_765261 [Caerostris extrusa]|uniref:Uncharacterized protein n=1 Tax=Caerostris extrusa TaxID=172846 RepID=A0AAV4M309_CAEEX|nr:hypothetical protein CEXT_765261 [Caerostris extrusa]